MEEVRPLSLRLTLRALRHLADIEAYIARDKPLAAMRVGGRLKESMEFLTEFPNVGHSGRRKNTLEWAVPDLPYIIVYWTRRDALEILGVYHGAQRRRT
jgi:plasmid stabilization system protein ParE